MLLSLFFLLFDVICFSKHGSAMNGPSCPMMLSTRPILSHHPSSLIGTSLVSILLRYLISCAQNYDLATLILSLVSRNLVSTVSIFWRCSSSIPLVMITNHPCKLVLIQGMPSGPLFGLGICRLSLQSPWVVSYMSTFLKGSCLYTSWMPLGPAWWCSCPC